MSPAGRRARCYLAGPMRGFPRFNHDAFNAATERLRAAGWEVFSPAEHDIELGINVPEDGQTDLPLTDFSIGEDLKQIAESDAVFFLPGWKTSEGCRLELAVAQSLGIPTYALTDRDTGSITEAREEEKSHLSWLNHNETVRPAMRQFETGATRNVDDEQPDYEGFLSPLVVEAFGRYMHGHRKQADGNLRDSDNWQKGIPMDAYMKSGWRHFMDWWCEHRGLGSREGMDAALAGLLFNVMGYYHEYLKAKE